MRFQQYIAEEYFKRFGKWEIFTNPSWKELHEIERDSNQQGTHGFIRFLLTKDLKTLYAFPASMLHGNAALVIDEENSTDIGRNYEIHYYPLQGVWDTDGVMLLDSSIAFRPSDKERESITKVMKDKFNIKVDFGEGTYKEMMKRKK
jgi:hypothetical protein